MEFHRILTISMSIYTTVRHSTDTSWSALTRVVVKVRARCRFSSCTSQRLPFIEERFKIEQHEGLILVRGPLSILVCQIAEHQTVGQPLQIHLYIVTWSLLGSFQKDTSNFFLDLTNKVVIIVRLVYRRWIGRVQLSKKLIGILLTNLIRSDPTNTHDHFRV